MKGLLPALGFLTLVALAGQESPFDSETLKIKPYLRQPSSCFSCHNENERVSDFRDPALSCDNLCLTCHREIRESHHPVGVRLASRNLTLQVSKFGRIACRTCHNLHVQRFDTSPWKSQTLYQRIFAKQDRYLTYFLARKNNNGELCTLCHK